MAPQISGRTLKKKNKRRILKALHKVTVIKTVWIWCQNKQDQWNRVEIPKIDPHTYIGK